MQNRPKVKKGSYQIKCDLLGSFLSYKCLELARRPSCHAGHVNLKNIYIDGTKIESVAGRYTFVWRKSIEKYQKKLKEQIIKELGLPEDSSLEYIKGYAKQAFNNI